MFQLKQIKNFYYNTRVISAFFPTTIFVDFIVLRYIER